MGMDVYGKNPKSVAGKYFRASVWGWHPLAECIEFVCRDRGRMDLYESCPHWHSNDGAGLTSVGARQLADLMEGGLRDGSINSYIRTRQEKLDATPDEPCHICNGTGIRTDIVGTRASQSQMVIPKAEPHPYKHDQLHPRAGETGWCNGCQGVGARRPVETWYRLSKEDIVEWIAFLKDCGGFEIH